MIYESKTENNNRTAERWSAEHTLPQEEELIERGYELLDSNPTEEVFDEVIFIFGKMYESHVGWELLAEALADVLTERVKMYPGSTFAEKEKSVQLLDRAILLDSKCDSAANRLRSRMINRINYGLWKEYRKMGDDCLLQNRYGAALGWYEKSVDRTDLFRKCLKSIHMSEESFRMRIHTAGNAFLEAKLAGKIPFVDIGECSSGELSIIKKLFTLCYPMFPCFAMAGKGGGKYHPYYMFTWQDESDGVIQTYIEENLQQLRKSENEKNTGMMIRCTLLILGQTEMLSLKEKIENNLQEAMG